MSNAVATRGPSPALAAVAIGESSWGMMYEQARALVASGFLPESVNTPEKAIAIILTGEELGIPKMLALRSINVIKGRPTLSADLMASLIYREIDRHKDGVFDILPPTTKGCTVRARRWGRTEVKEFTYTIEDAALAGYAGNAMYKQHPKAMLRARAVTAAARAEFADVVAGLYAPEEFDEEAPAAAPVVELVHRLDTNAEDLPERQLDADTGEILPTETIQSVKVEIQELVREAEYSDEDLKHVAVDLGIEAGWRELTLSQAQLIRDDIRKRMAEAEAEREAAAEVAALWEAVPLEAD